MRLRKIPSGFSRCLSLVCGVMCILGFDSVAYALGSGQYTAFDLAAQKIAITGVTVDEVKEATVTKVVQVGDTGAEDVTSKCQLKLDQLSIVPDKKCDALWAQRSSDTFKITLSKPAGTEVELKRGSLEPEIVRDFSQPASPILQVRDLPDATRTVIYIPGNEEPGRWLAVAPKSNQITVDPTLWTRLLSHNDVRVVATIGGKDTPIHLRRNQDPVAPSPVELPRGDLPALNCKAEVRNKKFLVDDNSPIFCVDTEPHQQLVIVGLPQREFIVPPNKTTYVVVRTWDDNIATVAMNGTVGISVPKLNAQVTAQGGTGDAAPKKRETYVTVWPLAPRTSGTNATVTVKIISRADRAVTIDQLLFDVAVDSVFYAALRLGIGVGFGEFDNGYQAQKVGGSAVSEVVATANRDVNLELVLGFAPYLDGLTSWNFKGRSYGDGLDVGFAPYFGIGIVSQSTSNLTAFRSFHAGGEIEIGRNFSIALTYVGRFVNDLPDGIAVGSAVPDGTLSTHAALASGGAVVLNLAPEFFKFAGGGK